MMKKLMITLLMPVMMFGCAPEKIKKKGFSPRQSRESRESADRVNVDSVSTPLKTSSLFYPMLPEQPRLQLLRAYTRDDFHQFKGGNKYYLQINRPYDIGSVKGKIYISDRTFKKVIIVDLQKRALTQIPGDYESAGIWITDKNHKYIADFHKKQIVVFDALNKLERTYANKDQFDKPVDVAVYGNKLYVCDMNKHEIIVVDKDSGDTIQRFGGIGTDEGKFYKPTHVIVDREGNLYVNDFFNFRIQKFDKDGNYIKTIGYPGDTLGGFARPKGLSIDREGHLYVVDAAFENVQIFDDNTTDLLLFFGGYGLAPGSMYLPNGIYVDYHNVEYFTEYADENFKIKYIVYVGNTLGTINLNVYGFGEWVGAPLTESEVEEKLTESEVEEKQENQ
jgi:hypothetical protein